MKNLLSIARAKAFSTNNGRKPFRVVLQGER